MNEMNDTKEGFSMDAMQEIIYPALDELRDIYDVTVEKTPDSALWGEGTPLASLDLVNLIITIERIIKTKYEKNVVLADASAFSSERSPFRTLASLASHIEKKLSQ